MTPQKRKEVMENCRRLAESHDKAGDVPMRTAFSNAWHELATPSEIKMAPSYLRWAGRK
jgi:hypothetical protein